jgi:membrane associated rhomboid family serine protease|tara:strand:+ start:918 stop:1511 length:594 start_codon:yes stop_codon:yes gene_type:complete
MFLTYYIIGINVFVSLIGLFAYPKVIEVGMMIPYRTIRNKTWYELITSGFVHGSISHLLFNMITLFFFGPVLENQIGELQFLGLYFTGLIVSSIPSLLKHRDDPQYATLGASGAVEAVLFGFILLFPFESLYLMFIPVPIYSIVFGIFFIGYSIYASKKEGTINHEAHIAGAAWGIIYMLAFVPFTIDHVLSMLGLL